MLSLIKNTVSLYIVQVGNMIIPIAIVPYLTRKLGMESFGHFSVLQAIAVYGVVLTDYGFQITGTKKVSRSLNDLESLNEIFSSILASKVLLALLALPLMVLSIRYLYRWELSLIELWAFLLTLLGSALTPLWLFHGMQRMEFVGIFTFISRVIMIVLMLLFVKSVEDIGIALLCQALSSFLIGLLSVYYAYRLQVRFRCPGFGAIKGELAEGWSMFTTAIFSAVLTNSGVLVLSLTASPVVVGGYAAVEKICRGIVSLTVPITQSLYPRVSQSYERSLSEGNRYLKRVSGLILLVGVLFALFMIGFGQLGGIGKVLGSSYDAFSSITYVMAVWLLLGLVNNILGIQFMTNNNMSRQYSVAFGVAAVLSVVMFYFMSVRFGYEGIPFSLVVGEFTLMSLLLFTLIGRLKR